MHQGSEYNNRSNNNNGLEFHIDTDIGDGELVQRWDYSQQQLFDMVNESKMISVDNDIFKNSIMMYELEKHSVVQCSLCKTDKKYDSAQYIRHLKKTHPQKFTEQFTKFEYCKYCRTPILKTNIKHKVICQNKYVKQQSCILHNKAVEMQKYEKILSTELTYIYAPKENDEFLQTMYKRSQQYIQRSQLQNQQYQQQSMVERSSMFKSTVVLVKKNNPVDPNSLDSTQNNLPRPEDPRPEDPKPEGPTPDPTPGDPDEFSESEDSESDKDAGNENKMDEEKKQRVRKTPKGTRKKRTKKN